MIKELRTKCDVEVEEEREYWMNQKANQHDNEIRKYEREKIRKVLEIAERNYANDPRALAPIKDVLFDFNEKISFNTSELGKGKHKLGAEAWASWQKHDYTEPDNAKNQAKEIEIEIN